MGKRVIVMWDCILNFEDAWHRRYSELFGEGNSIRRHSEYSREEQIAVLDSPGFFETIQYFRYAVEAVTEMLEQGCDIIICDTVWHESHRNKVQKLLHRVLPRLFEERRVWQVADRTALKADYLIAMDLQEGREKPEWQLLLVNTPYNRSVPGFAFTWKNIQLVLNRIR